MEKGKITKLNAWKSGKGSFIGIDGKEYVILTGTDAKIGDAVEFEIGTKFFSGKAVISKLLLPLEAYVQPARDEDRAKATPVFRAHEAPKDSREAYWQAKEKRDLEAKPIEIRLSCIASACVFYSQQAVMHEDVLGFAKKLEAYANGKQ
jgi:hypothetical protein